MNADTLIYNLYRAIETSVIVERKHFINEHIVEQARKYLEERNLLDQNEED